MMSSFIRSPCQGVCSATSLGDAVCRGCKRTAEEVRDWNTYKDQKKLSIIKRISDEKGKE